jgi:hypothetical protein
VSKPDGRIPRWVRVHQRSTRVQAAWMDLCQAICRLGPLPTGALPPATDIPERAAELHHAVLGYAAAYQEEKQHA